MRAGIFTTTLEKIVQIGSKSRHFKLVFDEGVDFDFKAGQFINAITAPEAKDAKPIKRPYSIASPPCWKGSLDLIWKLVDGGVVTNYLWYLKEGDKVTVQGPLGIFTIRTPIPKRIIFVSTGTGIAPFRSMIHQLIHEQTPCEIVNLFGTRYESDLLYREEFEDLAAKHPHFKNILTVSRPKEWKGETEYVQTLLKKYVETPKDTHIYICGLSNMIMAVKETAEAIGFTKEQIFFEKYD